MYFDPLDRYKDAMNWAAQSGSLQASLLQHAVGRRVERNRDVIARESDQRRHSAVYIETELAALQTPLGVFEAWMRYVIDAGQRGVLTLDALRKRGDIFLEHQAAGAPPVLIYDYEVVVDGKDLPRPCNYMLLHILSPEGVEVFSWKRPYVIIDPRAGHGPGIGGFKPDSQVGVALRDGHPVYFVAFRPMPEPGQVLADVTHAEAAFLREVQRRHPKSPKPVVVGNCQGGWAAAILAATNPDLAGPILLNGAPMSYWSGRIGQDPMRYNGGTLGGVVSAMMTADAGGGLFDGANLVLNFEMLNPGRTWFRKYYDLYDNIDRGEARFLEFEKWWGGFFLLTGDEIRWILENLFIGNRLSKNEARLETGRPIDLKAIRAPVIVFASRGDSITPPQQALNWIVDTYADETEIEVRGQRIVYMVHEEVGHLGIFVSSSIAKREHSQMASTLKTIEALPPGLYEMKIEDMAGSGHDKVFTVSFHRRRMTDILGLDDDRAEEAAFAAVSRLSETLAEVYAVTLRPLMRSLFSPQLAELQRHFHPLRVQRSVFASVNPVMTAVEALADEVRAKRESVPVNNPFKLTEHFWADVIESEWNRWRDLQAAWTETCFLTFYANPLAVWYGGPHAQRRQRKRHEDLRALPNVLDAVERISKGGLAEAVVRMLVLLADTRGNVRRDRLERSSQVLSTRKPFVDLDTSARARMIHEQTLISHFEPEQALATLPKLLTTQKKRMEALDLVLYVVGARKEMEPATAERIDQMRQLLGLTQEALPLQTSI